LVGEIAMVLCVESVEVEPIALREIPIAEAPARRRRA
jgi:hypothetical protein